MPCDQRRARRHDSQRSLSVRRYGRGRGCRSRILGRQAQPDAVWPSPTRVEQAGSSAKIDGSSALILTVGFAKCSLVLRARSGRDLKFRTLRAEERAEFEVAMRGMACVERTPRKTRHRAQCAKVKILN